MCLPVLSQQTSNTVLTLSQASRGSNLLHMMNVFLQKSNYLLQESQY